MIKYALPSGVALDNPVGNQRTIGEAFQAIMNWDTEDIRERMIGDGVVSAEQVDTAIIECRKFFMCIVVARAQGLGSVGMMSKTVDEVWHNAILFTGEYFALSAAILGDGRYLHHAPVVKSKLVASDEVRPNIFADVYHQLFGRIDPIWGVRYSEQQIGCNCSPPDPGSGGELICESSSLKWEDAMQGLCVSDVLENDCNGVCHPDTCNGGSGQLCNDIPFVPKNAIITADCDGKHCRCMPAPTDCQSEVVQMLNSQIVCVPSAPCDGGGQLCDTSVTCKSDSLVLNAQLMNCDSRPGCAEQSGCENGPPGGN